MRSEQAFLRMVDSLERGASILDVGSGSGFHADLFRDEGFSVITNSLIPPADIIGDFLGDEFLPQLDGAVDGIWASHVLEHQVDPGAFLRRCFAILAEGGVLAITVPHDRRDLAGGHVIAWSEGLLAYHLVLAGFDCSRARVGLYSRQLSFVVRKVSRPPVEGLINDKGDLEKLAEFFPWPVRHRGTAFLGAARWRRREVQ